VKFIRLIRQRIQQYRQYSSNEQTDRQTDRKKALYLLHREWAKWNGPTLYLTVTVHG